MADTNYFYDIEIFSLTSTTQNPLHLLADAAYISENNNNSNKLTHEIPSHYTCSTNCSDYNQEIFGKSLTSNYSTNLTDNNETTKLEQKKIRQIKSGHKINSQIKSSNDDYLNSGFSTLSKNPSMNFNSSKQDFKVKRVEFKYDREKIQLLEQNSVVNKNQDIKNPFHFFNNSKIIEKPISLSSNDKSKVGDIKKSASLLSIDKSKDDDTKKQIPLSSNDKSKDDNVKKSVSLSSSKKSKNNVKKPIQLSNKNGSRKKITKKQNNTKSKKQKIVKNYKPSQLRIQTKTYTTRSSRISKPPSASSGGRWTGS